MKLQYSDEIINAFVDGELDGHERNKFKQAMLDDSELAAQVERVCGLKKSLKQSYADIALPGRDEDGQLKSSRYVFWNATAAVLLISVGIFCGWHLNQSVSSSAILPQQAAISGVQLNPVNFEQPGKVVLHVSSSNPDKLRNTLEQVDKIIERFQSNHLPFAVEVVANAGGLDLLRDDVSPYRDRIMSIMQTYDNVSFVACSNTIDNLVKQGKTAPPLISNIKTDMTAVDQIVKRLQQGWMYVKV